MILKKAIFITFFNQKYHKFKIKFDFKFVFINWTCYHKKDIQEFLIGDRNININIKINKEFEENTKENIFEFIVFDYFQSSNIQKIFGNSEFLFILNEENKIIFTTKSYRLKNFMYSMKISFYALIFYFIIIMPSIENLIIISD